MPLYVDTRDWKIRKEPNASTIAVPFLFAVPAAIMFLPVIGIIVLGVVIARGITDGD